MFILNNSELVMVHTHEYINNNDNNNVFSGINGADKQSGGEMS